jgi:hypothetical protein
MRVTSLIILVLVVLGIGYVVVFKRDWIFKGQQLASGYTAAATPDQAMNKFRDAILNRQYKYAATYCTGPYAELLLKAHDAAVAVGGEIDSITDYMKNKGLQTDRSVLLLYNLDPFPKSFIVKGMPEKKGETKSVGAFQMDWPVLDNKANFAKFDEWTKDLDIKMFQNVLTPRTDFGAVEIVKEGDAWKLIIPIPPGMADAVNYFNDKYRTYQTTLGDFRSAMNNGRYDRPQTFENELVQAIPRKPQ